MSTEKDLERRKLRQQALARWDSEGGSTPPSDAMGAATSSVPPLTNAELVQLQVRVIALENLVLALLAEASDAQRELVRDMATYISPRPGFTRHPLTLHAATQMLHVVERARHFIGLDVRLNPRAALQAPSDIQMK
jgi:hypothetical protein